MTPGMLGKEVVGRPFAQKLNGQPLVLDVLQMLERQVGSTRWSFVGNYWLKPESQNVPCHRQGLCIGAEGVRRSTKDVAGHLVEQDAERQRAVGTVLPVIQAAFGRSGIEVG